MLMIKTSTENTNSRPDEMVTLSEASDDLGEDELAVYSAIQKDLKEIEVTPKDSLIEAILNYSRSL